jgi:hypothetical protein
MAIISMAKSLKVIAEVSPRFPDKYRNFVDCGRAPALACEFVNGVIAAAPRDLRDLCEGYL